MGFPHVLYVESILKESAIKKSYRLLSARTAVRNIVSGMSFSLGMKIKRLWRIFSKDSPQSSVKSSFQY